MPAPNSTIYALTEEARRLPDNSLITNLQNHSGSIPSWVLLGEVERRKALRDGATASKEPEGTVAEDAIAGLQSIAQQSPQAPQPQPQAPQGPMQPQMPTASMAAGGGIRSLAEGGGVEDELQAGDEAAAFYASQAEQEDGDGPDDEGEDDVDEPDYGGEDYEEGDVQSEDDGEEQTPNDSEDDIGSYARGGRIKKRTKRFAEGGGLGGGGDASGTGGDIGGFADMGGSFGDVSLSADNPGMDGPSDGMSGLDFLKIYPESMPAGMAEGGSVDSRLIRPASGPPVPMLRPNNIEGPPGAQPQSAQVQAPQNEQERMDRIRQLRLQAAVDSRQNSMRRNDPRYAHGMAGQFGLDPKEVAGRLQAESMKKGGVVKFEEGRAVKLFGGTGPGGMPTVDVPADGYDPSEVTKRLWGQGQIGKSSVDVERGLTGQPPQAPSDRLYPGDMIFDAAPQSENDRMTELFGGYGNVGETGGTPDSFYAAPNQNPRANSPEGSGPALAIAGQPISMATSQPIAQRQSGSNGGAQTQTVGSPQLGQPGGRQAMSEDALTADSILKAQMDAIKDRTEDRKSAQERANNDALIAMGAAMMGAKGPNALAALGEGINAGTAARRATMATSDAIAQQNIQNRHAIASDLIKQNYYNGTISAKQAHTQQMALNAAMSAGNAAAGRGAANARAQAAIDAKFELEKGRDARAGEKASALDKSQRRSLLNAELLSLSGKGSMDPASAARIDSIRRQMNALN